jgi:hypothetical protein
MPAAAFDPVKFAKGRKIRERFGKRAGVRGTGAPRNFTKSGGNVADQTRSRRMQKTTKGPKKTKGAALAPGKIRLTGHSMGGMFGFSPKKSEPDNRPPKQSEKRADIQARAKRLRNLLI